MRTYKSGDVWISGSPFWDVWSQGTTKEEAERMAREALTLFLEGMDETAFRQVLTEQLDRARA